MRGLTQYRKAGGLGCGYEITKHLGKWAAKLILEPCTKDEGSILSWGDYPHDETIILLAVCRQSEPGRGYES
jgi:hypothetical protein